MGVNLAKALARSAGALRAPALRAGLIKVFFRTLKALRAFIYHLLGPYDIFDLGFGYIGPKTTKIGYTILPLGPFGLTFVKND